jgi:hypothetical protein
MGMRRIVYRADGTVAVITPAPKSKRVDETEAQWLKRVFNKAMAVQDDLYGQPYDDVDESEIPNDRKHRDAWTGSEGNGISIDATKKAEIDARPTPEREELIHAEMRKMAEERLIARGEL